MKDTDPKESAPCGFAESPKPKANCDQESWVMNRIKTAIAMSMAVAETDHVRAEADMIDRAIHGIVEGAATEIIRTLGMEPSFTNISRR